MESYFAKSIIVMANMRSAIFEVPKLHFSRDEQISKISIRFIGPLTKAAAVATDVSFWLLPLFPVLRAANSFS